MKTYLIVVVGLLVEGFCLAQNPVQRRLQHMNAEAAAANAAEARRQAAAERALVKEWGPRGPWWADANWQKCTNMAGRLRVEMDKNKKELELLGKVTAAGVANPAQVARERQLSGYVTNQAAALRTVFGQKEAIESKYKLRDLNAKPRAQ